MRKILRYHSSDLYKKLTYITTELINLPDYCLNAKLSLIGSNTTIA